MPYPRANPALPSAAIPSASLRAPRTSILTRAVRQYVLFAVFIVLTLSVISFVIARAFLEQRVLAQLSSIVAAKEDLVEQVMQNDRARAALLASRNEMADILNGAGEDWMLGNLMSQMRQEHIPVLGMAVFDLGGERVAQTDLPPKTAPPESQSTVTRAVVDEYGWQEHEIFTSIRNWEGNRIGTLGMRYDSRPLRDVLLSIASVGETGEVLLGMKQMGELVLLHHRFQPVNGRTLILGALEEQYKYGSPLALAVMGEESLGRAEDYTGREVYAAYRTIPTLGWGLVVKISRSEALAGTTRLAIFLCITGAVLIIGTGLIAYYLARKLTEPILNLSSRIVELNPRNWGFEHSIKTGDEVEVLDRVVADMASRLKKAYGHLEEMVEERTKELKQQYAKDRAILQNIQYGVVTMGPTGVIIDANPSAGRLLKKEHEDILGTRIEETVPLCHHKRIVCGKNHPALCVLKRKRGERADPNKRMNIICEGGVVLPVSYVISPIMEGEKLLGAVMVFQDMTEERRVDYIKSEFISLASHQLRTPLSTIRWFLEILSDKKSKELSQVQRESIKEMEQAANRMSNLIDTLLHAARLEGETITPKMQAVDITGLIREMAEECRTLAKDSGIACSVNIPQESMNVATDPILLHVVLQNLFSNAVKYSESGGKVTLSLVSNPPYVEISVADTGIGIPRQEQKRVFEKLFRARNVRAVDTGGSGLGLYISKMVTEIIGGEISFVSGEGKGTTFTVRLPVDHQQSTLNIQQSRDNS